MVDFHIIMPQGRSQTQKSVCRMTAHVRAFLEQAHSRHRLQIGSCPGPWVGAGIGCQRAFWGNESVLKGGGRDGCTTI